MATEKYDCECGNDRWFIEDGQIECSDCGKVIYRPAAKLWPAEQFNALMTAHEFDDMIPE